MEVLGENAKELCWQFRERGKEEQKVPIDKMKKRYVNVTRRKRKAIQRLIHGL